MKKGIAGILVALLLVISAVYIFIPSSIRISDSLAFKTSRNGTLRSISDKNNWESISAGQFQISRLLSDGVNLTADSNGQHPVHGKIMLIPMRADSVVIAWEFNMDKADGWLSRIKHYISAVSLKKRMDSAMHYFKDFCEKNENVYGMAITTRSTTDTLLVATKFSTSHYPTNEEIYGHIGALKQYLSTTKASVSGLPMLNIRKTDSGSFTGMVALPIDHIVEGEGRIFFVRMVPGKFLTAQTTGGPFAIQRARDMMQLYFQDFQRTAMAIPFEYMVTDRLREKDTSRWVTRIYAPVY